MRRELDDHRDQLIDTIEGELERLRARRNQMEYQTIATQQKKLTNKSINAYNINQINNPVQRISVQDKLKLKNDLSRLQELYKTKKQLSQIGIKSNDPNKLLQYKNDPKMASHIQNKKQIAAKNAYKKKILQQELQKTEQFLNNKKIAVKQLSQLQLMNYRYLLENKKQQLQEYEKLILKKKGLSRLQKDDLMQMTFGFLREWNNMVKKQYFKMFLKANPQFCQHFFITNSQINRDLQVLETGQQGFLTQRQMKQFIKSIEITNPHIDPMMKNRIKRQTNKKKTILSSNNNDEYDCIINKKIHSNVVIDSKRLGEGDCKKKPDLRKMYKKAIQYLRKVYKSMDRFSEGVVERSKFVASIQKGVLNQKKQVQLEMLKEFGQLIRKLTVRRQQKNYYQELDAKFITFSEVQNIFKQFWTERTNKQNKKDANQPQNSQLLDDNMQQIQKSEENNNQQPEQSEIDTAQYYDTVPMPKNGKLCEQDYQRYGWKNYDDYNKYVTQIQKQHPKLLQNQENNEKDRQLDNLKQLDKYYKQMSDKNMAEIEWEGFNQYKADFKQLQAFIHNQQSKLKNNK